MPLFTLLEIGRGRTRTNTEPDSRPRSSAFICLPFYATARSYAMTQPDKTAPAPKLIPASSARTEIRASNSRFIASAAPAATVEAARRFIAGVRAEMPDASHHVYAYIVGHGATTTLSMTDDGEPPGTAGRPVMAVLKGSGLGDVALVVTRYFGGTLLGTGGLVHAYGDAAKAVLTILPRAEKIERRELI